MKPFLLLSIRSDADAADEEYAAFVRFSGLDPSELVRHHLDRDPLGEVDLAQWNGIVLGGGPYNVSDPDAAKSDDQRRAEAELAALAERVIAEDFPFLGACYGIGVLGTALGAGVGHRYAEPIGAVPVSLTDAGRTDPVFSGLPSTFEAFVGHKEAVDVMPDRSDVAVLASSPACPVQAFRVGRYVYATQFHPELDVDGLCTRITTYRHHGYYEPSEHDALIAMARASVVVDPPTVLRGFVAAARDRTRQLRNA